MTGISDSEMLAEIGSGEALPFLLVDQPNPASLELQPDQPISCNGQSFSKLSLCEPTLYQVMKAARKIGTSPTPDSLYEADITLISEVSAWPEAALEQLKSSLLDQAREFVSGFETRAREELAEKHAAPAADPLPEITLVFNPPLSGGGQDYTEMRLREPVVAERRRYMRQIKQPSWEIMLRADAFLVEIVSAWHRAAVLRLPISRFVEASGYLQSFFGDGRKTGETSPLI